MRGPVKRQKRGRKRRARNVKPLEIGPEKGKQASDAIKPVDVWGDGALDYADIHVFVERPGDAERVANGAIRRRPAGVSATSDPF